MFTLFKMKRASSHLQMSIYENTSCLEISNRLLFKRSYSASLQRNLSKEPSVEMFYMELNVFFIITASLFWQQ